MWKWVAATLIGLVPGALHSACIHHGIFYPTTTLEQEFAESRWVVLARVESARDHRPDDGPAWSLYRLRVLRSYKGRLPERFSFFTDRNTGGFYMDRPWEGHDIGGDYLLFLNPRDRDGDPPAARGSTFVNYTCGQSRTWAGVPAADRALLDRLSAR